jgi:hypothetical protein
MDKFGLYQLTAAACGTIVAVARSEEVVQNWDSATGEKVSELKTSYEYGGFRLALNPTGSLCAVASYYKGRRGGIACYDVRSGQMIWHRPDIGQTQCVRFASDGRAVYCGREAGPLLRLCGASGETLKELSDTADVQESPYSAHALVVPRSGAYVLQGVSRFCLQRRSYLSDCMHKRTCSPTAIGFGGDSVWVAESGLGPMLRCFDYTGSERWQVEIPEDTIICQLCYRPADGHFYGVEWDRQKGWCRLVRYSDDGAGEKVASTSAAWGHQGFCLNGDMVVGPKGDVIETARGTTVNTIAFQ